jgi:hypothetical protein
MSAEPRHLKIERQTSDAAKRLSRLTGAGCITLAVVNHGDGQTGLAFAVDDLSDAQVEFACFMLLSQLASKRMEGAAEGCAECTQAWSRTSSAAEALRPGFGPGWAERGACQ